MKGKASSTGSEFELLRLDMLARQFPGIVQGCGQVVFAAEDDEARLSHASWRTEGDLFERASETGFKQYLMELIDCFIQYRAQIGQAKRKNGVVRINRGSLMIEWLSDGDRLEAEGT